MEKISIKKLCDNPEFLEESAIWFSKKWGIPVEEYKESIQECIDKKIGVPQWYVVVNEKQEMIGGAGVIENDFHNRKDLTPNLCALFVEEPYRKQGIAKFILDFIRKEMGAMGVAKLYLVTDHTEFYEKCGWEFLTMVEDVEGILERMYVVDTL